MSVSCQQRSSKRVEASPLRLAEFALYTQLVPPRKPGANGSPCSTSWWSLVRGMANRSLHLLVVETSAACLSGPYADSMPLWSIILCGAEQLVSLEDDLDAFRDVGGRLLSPLVGAVKDHAVDHPGNQRAALERRQLSAFPRPQHVAV